MQTMDDLLSQVQDRLYTELLAIGELVKSAQKNYNDPSMRDYAVEQMDVIKARVKKLAEYVI